MKLLHANIHGFGKFYQRSFSFQDGLHVLYGANEAGKSTLHTFTGCMFFGLERGRGKAARRDLYSRFLPWEHDTAYGGSLSFESGEQDCLLERCFLTGRRSAFLSTPDKGRFSCQDMNLSETYLEGLTEELYYNTLSVRQLKSAVNVSLSAQLQQHFRDIRQTGNVSVSYDAAKNWLTAEKKKLEAQITEGLELDIEKKRQTADEWEKRLQDISFLQEKQDLEEQMAICMEEMGSGKEEYNGARAGEKGGVLHDEGAADGGYVSHDESAADDAHVSSAGRGRPAFVCRLAAFACLAAAFLFLWNGRQTPALAAGGGAVLFVLAACLTSRRKRSGELSNERRGRALPLRRRMASLQKQYQDACRREWEHERLAEQAQALDDTLNRLAGQAEAEAETRLNLQAVHLALSTLQRVSARLEDSIGPHINAAMSEILSGLTGGAYEQVYVDGGLNISLRTGARTVPLEALSRGTIEQVWLALRLAAIDIVFPQGGMPLLLDDCFLAYDDERLLHTLSWLAENYSGQVLIFTCQKREAALLQKKRIPFTLITL